MERIIAIRKLKKLLGPRAVWRIEDGVSSPEKRERYHSRIKAANEAKRIANEAMSARAAEVLKGDAEYQRLSAIYQKACEVASDTRYHDDEGGYKFTVGTANGLFFTVEAEGDTWEEVFQKLTARKVKP